jgi:hypothetical protein
MLMMTAFMTPMIAQIMRSVVVIMVPVKLSVMLLVGAMFSIYLIISTVPPVVVVITVKVVEGGRSIVVLSLLIEVSAGLGSILFS